MHKRRFDLPTPFMWVMGTATALLVSFFAWRTLNSLTVIGWALVLIVWLGVASLAAAGAASAVGADRVATVLTGVGVTAPFAGVGWFIIWYFEPSVILVPGRRKRQFL
jgi:hypothetical protein